MKLIILLLGEAVNRLIGEAAAAQTTRNDSPCTAGAPGKPQQPRRPERKARAPQERSAPTPVKKNSRFSQKSKKHVVRMRPKISKKEISHIRWCCC